MINRALLIAVCAVGIGNTAGAQRDAAATVNVERVAARAVMKSLARTDTTLRVAINPLLAVNAHGPRTQPTLRDASRNRDLASDVGGRVVERRDAFDCSSERCRLVDMDVYMSLSEPVLEAGKALVTVTISKVHKASGRLYNYSTNVYLERRGAGWEVVRFETIGIS